MANATFQGDRLATVPVNTVVAAHDRDGVLYQRFIEGLDYGLVFYDGNDNIEYRCVHSDPDAATSDTDWIIGKYSYSGENFSGWRVKTGSVDGRVALFA